MGISKIMEKTRTRLDSTIKTLPDDLVTEILAQVASSSITDLFNARITCKGFNQLGDDNQVLRRLSIENFPVVPWRISYEAASFLTRCQENGNPEVLFRQGMVEYFSSMQLELGLECLNRAASLGHIEASYVLGIILVCNGNLKGLELLNTVKSSRSRRMGVKECFQRSKRIIRQLWINNLLSRPEPMCRTTGCIRNGGMRGYQKRRGWPLSDKEGEEEEGLCCETCNWDGEINDFCNMLYGIY